MTTEHDGSTPGYDDGWFNGNPRLMIAAGTYPKYKDRLKGFSPSQMKQFDAEWKAARAAGAETQEEIIERKIKAREKNSK